METMTISQLSKAYGITTRTLRYYEEIGLIESVKKEDYAYRTYDDATVRRLQQIILLRKLRIKLQDIARILQNNQAIIAIEVFEECLKDVSEEIKALDTIRYLYEKLLMQLRESMTESGMLGVVKNDVLLETIQSLPLIKTKLKEDKVRMEDLNKVNENIQRLRDEEVRIIYLPSVTVASAHYIGENPEDQAQAILNQFVKEQKLNETNKGFRVFGFNNPSPKRLGEVYGYEFCVTIPAEYDVPKPLEKKILEGGMYAVYCIKMGDFEKWPLLWKWVEASQEYDYDKREPLGMDGALEEHLNAPLYYVQTGQEQKFIQLDLMVPIRQKK